METTTTRRYEITAHGSAKLAAHEPMSTNVAGPIEPKLIGGRVYIRLAIATSTPKALRVEREAAGGLSAWIPKSQVEYGTTIAITENRGDGRELEIRAFWIPAWLWRKIETAI